MRPKKKYLIALEETRSVVALAAGILVFFCALACVFVMAENYAAGQDRQHPLQYFTVWANLLSAVASAFMIPYAAEGIRKKRFVLPRWIVLLQFSGAVSLAVTMIAALAFILPALGSPAVTGTNFWLHVVTPALTVVLFQCVESGVAFTRRDSLSALIPLFLYMAVYFVTVVLIGEKNGGWSDFYMVGAYWSPLISALLMLAIGFAVSLILRLVQNRRAARSKRRIFRAWSGDPEPTQLLIEAFGLGRYVGARCPVWELTVPLDIFILMEEKYGVGSDKLTKAYVKGALDAALEKRKDK
ncbi:MAG: hypothetical protein J5879_03200 [Clostridia bacterium]|nr:hypothetical protein [Clostridia bacterium]